MVKLYRVILVLLSVATAASYAYAQDHIVTYSNLAQNVELREHSDGSLQRHIRHVDAQPSSDPLRPFDVLITSGDAPENAVPIATFEVHKWVDVGGLDDVMPQQPQASSRIIGSKAWIPVYATTVSPWKTEGGRLWIADSITVITSFNVQQGIEPQKREIPSVLRTFHVLVLQR